ncbi:MAG TPA: SRPBCC domain-containing protein, partial [Saprospiraceae bacterium]|nr:SRPBCC domain-containing protein [Saprospiraceae bacterium]
MATPQTIESEITIKATKDKVWDALVNPEQTKKYMYGCEPVSDWAPGSPLLWNGEYEGKVMTFVKGNIVTIRPDEYLEYTVIDP